MPTEGPVLVQDQSLLRLLRGESDIDRCSAAMVTGFGALPQGQLDATAVVLIPDAPVPRTAPETRFLPTTRGKRVR
jgi:hypothetical protein